MSIDTTPHKLTADQQQLVSAIRAEVTATLAACNDLLALLQGADQEFESEAARQRFIHAVDEIVSRQSGVPVNTPDGSERPYLFGDAMPRLSEYLSDTVDDWLPEATG